MFGNTHTVAEGIAAGLRSDGEVRVVPVSEASEDALSWADLVIVGGPTHVHGMTRPTDAKERHGDGAEAGQWTDARS